MTNENFAELVEKYSAWILDSMDMKTMEQFCFDSLVDCYTKYTPEELVSEIKEHYGTDDEILEEFGISN
jgi:hypothetical protein